MKVSIKKDFVKLFDIQKTSTGFTLIELLVAMSLTTIVVGVAGFGLVTIMGANNKGEAETQRRENLNRALDFISDQVRVASVVSDTAPNWATDSDDTNPPNSASDWINKLGGGSPEAKLFIQIPLTVESMTASNAITVSKHGLIDGYPVMFTGSGTLSSPLLKNKVYYVRDVNTDTFNVSSSPGGSAIPLTTNSSGSLIANRLVIYYIRDNTSTWLPPKTINRSPEPCVDARSCPALIDSIAANGFTATVTSSRKAEIRLIGQLTKDPTPTYEVSTTAFARSGLLASGSTSSSTSSGTTSSGTTSSGTTSSGTTSSGTTSSGTTSSGTTSSGTTSSGTTSSGTTSSGTTSSGTTSSGTTSSGTTSSGTTSSGTTSSGTTSSGTTSSGTTSSGTTSSGTTSSGTTSSGTTSSGTTSSGTTSSGTTSSGTTSSGTTSSGTTSSGTTSSGTTSSGTTSSGTTSSGTTSSGGAIVVAAPTLTGTRANNNMNLSWTWTGSGSVTYKVYHLVGGVATQVYSGANTSFSANITGSNNTQNCYYVTATVGLIVSSNSSNVCVAK